MNKTLTSGITSLILMFIIVSFTLSFAIKQFFVLKEQVYEEAFYNIK